MMSRRSTLEQALEYVTNDRNKDNGDPEDNFRNIAELWTYWIAKRYDVNFIITPTDVAVMSMMIKIARLLGNIYKEDNWIDIAGYSACGSETAQIELNGIDGSTDRQTQYSAVVKMEDVLSDALR